MSDARRRFGDVASALASAPVGGAMRTGFAELVAEDESADELIARADRELLDSRSAWPRDAAGAFGPRVEDRALGLGHTAMERPVERRIESTAP